MGGLDVLVDADDMGAFLDEAMGGLLADAGAGADDDDNLTGEFLLRRHALQFRFFEQPVLDVEGFLLRQGDVLVDSFGATHDFDGAVVELSRDAGFGLILAPSNHAEAGDEHDGRVRIAHRRRVRALAGIIISGVVLAVLLEGGGELGLQRGGVFGLGIPIHVERLDLRAEEMVRAGSAELGEARSVLRVHEAENLLVVLDGADETLLIGDLAAEPWEDGGEGRVSLLGVEGLVEGAAEDLGVAALGLVLGVDEGRGLLDHGEGQFIAGLIVVGPGDEAVLAHHDGLHGWLLAGDVLHGEAELEAWAHPLHVGHLAGEDLLREGFAVLGSGDRDDRVRVHVVDVLARQEAVQRGVDRRSARIQVERRVIVHADHVVFGLGLEALILAGRVGLLEADELVLIERGEVLTVAGAEVAARTLDPEDLGVGSCQGVLLDDLGGGIAAASIRDALVGSELVGAIDQTADRIELRGFGIVPEVRDVLVVGHVCYVEIEGVE